MTSSARKIPSKGRQRAEFKAFRERARRNEGSAPRKHHLVPAFYLRRWAEKDRIRVTEVERGTSYETSPAKAARITDFYRLEAEGLDPAEVPPLLFETALGEVETWGREAIEELVTQPDTMDPGLMSRFAWFLGFQFTRGRAIRQEMRALHNEWFMVKYGDLSDEGIRSELRRRGADPTAQLVEESRRFLEKVRDGKLTVEPQDAALVGAAAQAAKEIGEHILYRTWFACRTPRILVTCDEPVVTIGGPGSPRGERSGVATAGLVVFPLSPDRLLVMMREDLASEHGVSRHREDAVFAEELDHVENAEICREIIMNAYRWGFERPGRRVAAQFYVPAESESAVLEEVGPIREGDKEGVLMRTFRTTRWKQWTVPPPWPVARWWWPDRLRWG